jgi:hypothetical protein
MRLAPRLAAPAIVLALIAAGCGSQLAFQEVPGDPPQVTVPGTAEAFAPAATPTPTPTTDASSTDTASASPTPAPTETTTTGGQTDTGATAGGGTAAQGTDDGQTNDQPPPAGSPAQQFEDYCAANPGAC